MSFEEVNQQAKLYKIILQNHYDDFTNYYIGEITYDDFSCKVDIAYRIEHGMFPQIDERMAYNLPQVITDVGRELMQAIDEAYQDEETDLSPYSQNRLYKASSSTPQIPNRQTLHSENARDLFPIRKI